MENKINIAEILKDCPRGMELDCTMYENVTLIHIFEGSAYPIKIKTPDGQLSLNEYGQYSHNKLAKCIIFPKGKTTWEGFVPPYKFKDGDVVFYSNTIAIFKEWGDETLFRTYCTFYPTVSNPTYQFEIGRPLFGKGIRREARFATKEEREELFKAINANGYKWNKETKTLERLPKFKVGDRVKKKDSNEDIVLITDIADNYYIVETQYGMEVTISIGLQDNWELVPNKFDITTLKPFDKVLVKTFHEEWKADFFSHYSKEADFPYSTVGKKDYYYCIPYEGNEHLLGTTDDCIDFYKTWE